VIGDMDLIRPLGLAGIRCAAVAGARDPVRFSRFTDALVEPHPIWEEPESQVQALLRFGAAADAPPVLFYEGDPDLLMISRRRDVLRDRFRFVIPAAELVEDLVDKSRFRALAERLDLPLPRTYHLRPGREPLPDDIELPLVVKPLIRLRGAWDHVGGGAKARQVANAEELRELWKALAATGVDVLAQELVAGPESRIESYHAYVGAGGETVAEFTGAKIRTSPPAYGNSTALTTTVAPDVMALGRSILRRLGFTGVAKIDFKRAPDDALKILEVNPRFNLWHHLAAVAGLNIPALVYADLVDGTRPPVAPVPPGITWSAPWADLRAFRAAGRSPLAWAAWTARCDAVSGLAWDDPLPFVCGQLAPRVAGRLRPLPASPAGMP